MSTNRLNGLDSFVLNSPRFKPWAIFFFNPNFKLKPNSKNELSQDFSVEMYFKKKSHKYKHLFEFFPFITILTSKIGLNNFQPNTNMYGLTFPIFFIGNLVDIS
jgi:hypothetical protein